MKIWNEGDVLSWDEVNESTFLYYNIFPMAGTSMAFLGEVHKFVPVSPDRFQSIEFVPSKGDLLINFNVDLLR